MPSPPPTISTMGLVRRPSQSPAKCALVSDGSTVSFRHRQSNHLDFLRRHAIRQGPLACQLGRHQDAIRPRVEPQGMRRNQVRHHRVERWAPRPQCHQGERVRQRMHGHNQVGRMTP